MLAMTRNTSAVAGYTCVYLTIIPQAWMGSESIALGMSILIHCLLWSNNSATSPDSEFKREQAV